jgi:hypothetical protein
MSVDLGSGAAGSQQTVAAGGSVVVGMKVQPYGGPVDACAGWVDDTDIFFTAQEIARTVWD